MMQKKEMIMQFFESDLDPRLCMIEDMIPLYVPNIPTKILKMHIIYII